MANTYKIETLLILSSSSIHGPFKIIFKFRDMIQLCCITHINLKPKVCNGLMSIQPFFYSWIKIIIILLLLVFFYVNLSLHPKFAYINISFQYANKIHHYGFFNFILFSCFENQRHDIDSATFSKQKHKGDFYHVALVHWSSKSAQLIRKNIRCLRVQLLTTHLIST